MSKSKGNNAGPVRRTASILDRKGRTERLREIVKRVQDGKRFSAFDLAVEYDISINVVYRDIKTLRDEGLIPKDFMFARKGAICTG